MSRTDYAIGAKVRVQWGVDEVEGTVEDVYEGSAGVRVKIRIPLLDPDGGELDHISVVLPALGVHAA